MNSTSDFLLQLLPIFAGQVGRHLCVCGFDGEWVKPPDADVATAFHEAAHAFLGYLVWEHRPARVCVRLGGGGGYCSPSEAEPTPEELAASGSDGEQIETLTALVETSGWPVRRQRMEVGLARLLIRNWGKIERLAQRVLKNEGILNGREEISEILSAAD